MPRLTNMTGIDSFGENRMTPSEPIADKRRVASSPLNPLTIRDVRATHTHHARGKDKKTHTICMLESCHFPTHTIPLACVAMLNWRAKHQSFNITHRAGDARSYCRWPVGRTSFASVDVGSMNEKEKTPIVGHKKGR